MERKKWLGIGEEEEGKIGEECGGWDRRERKGRGKGGWSSSMGMGEEKDRGRIEGEERKIGGEPGVHWSGDREGGGRERIGGGGNWDHRGGRGMMDKW